MKILNIEDLYILYFLTQYKGVFRIIKFYRVYLEITC